MGYMVLACRYLLGVVFAMSVAGKVRHRTAFAEFVAALRGMHVVPWMLAPTAAAAVVALEALVPLGLLSRYTAPVAFALVVALMVGFGWAIVHSVRRGYSGSCRCFGPASAPPRYRHLVRNLLVAAVALVGIYGLSAAPPAGIRWAGAAAAGFAAAVLASLIVRFDDVVELFP